MNFFFLLLLPTLAFAFPSKDFQFEQSLKIILQNASMPDVRPGMVVASPSKENPNYYYDWVRDTALTARAMIDLWELTKEARLKEMISQWVESEILRQNTPSLSGLGEPKFNIDGTSFSGPWGRPQNDGPALRALAMIKWARLLKDSGELEYVHKKLYFGILPASTPIKKDLEYVSHHWSEENFDPWEEEMGMHFYNLLIQHTALQEGSKLAFELGDFGAASFYQDESDKIGNFIKKNFLDQNIGIVASRFVVKPLGYKNSGIDVAPLLALIHTWPYQSLISLNDHNVKKYVSVLIETFKGLYPVNTGSEVNGVSLGRYPEDRYDGYQTTHSGNPWFIATLALAEYYCVSQNPLSQKLADQQIGRVLFHSDRQGHLDEQFNRKTGLMQGANDLTWSHVAFLTASLRCKE
jgi:glucoamylase